MAIERNCIDLLREMFRKGKHLCVGLDPDPKKIPPCLDGDIYGFLMQIILTTGPFAAAFKPNSAFFEAEGQCGGALYQEVVDFIHRKFPEIPVIRDAKRGDIGNSTEQYAEADFRVMEADGATVNPLMGQEAVQPYLDRTEKAIFLLCLTSNPGSSEFLRLQLEGGEPLFERIARNVAEKWNSNGNCGLVVGATHPNDVRLIRNLVGSDMPLLLPGFGKAQGGRLEDVIPVAGDNFLANLSRGILYASDKEDCFEAAAREAEKQDKLIRSLRR